MASAAGLKYFSDREFPANTLPFMNPSFMAHLDKWREELGHRVYPSPLRGAWVRTTGSTESRHYAKGRLSDAGDVFVSCDHKQAWLSAVASRRFGGIGIYYDTKFRGDNKVMLHLDCREGSTVVWARHKGEYIYPARTLRERLLFFKLLNEENPWTIS